MIGRIHHKILKTILDLPVCCNSKALLHIMGTLSINALIHQRQLNFIHSFTFLAPDSLPLQLLQKRLENPLSIGLIPPIQNTLVHHGFPPINAILAGQWSQGGWKRIVKRFLLASQYAHFLTECDHIPLSQCMEVKLGRTIPHLFACRGFSRVTKRNITRIRLLVNCHGLESDTCRFRHSVSDPTCRLCHSGPEDIEHFISHCPALSSAVFFRLCWPHRKLRHHWNLIRLPLPSTSSAFGLSLSDILTVPNFTYILWNFR